MRLKFEMYGSHCREICSGSCFLHFSDSQNRVAIAAGNVQGIGDFPNERFCIWLAICIARPKDKTKENKDIFHNNHKTEKPIGQQNKEILTDLSKSIVV